MADIVRTVLDSWMPATRAWERWLALALLPAAVALGYLISTLENRFVVLVLAALAGFCLLALTFRYERLPFHLLVATLPLETAFNLGGVPNPLLFAFGGLAAVTLAWRMATGQRRFVYEPLSTALGVGLIVWTGISAYNAGGLAAVLLDARSYVLVLILFLLAQNYLREKTHFVETAWVLAVSLGVVGAMVFLGVGNAYLQSGGAMSGKAMHQFADGLFFNTPAGILGMQISKGIPFAVYLAVIYVGRHRLLRLFLMLLVAAMTLGTLAVVSLNATFGLFVTFALLVLFMQRRSRQLNVALMSAAVFTVALLSPASPFTERIEQQMDFWEAGDTLRLGSNRGLAWYIGWQTTVQAPLLGIGPSQEALLEASQSYIPIKLYRRKVAQGREVAGLHPHNFYLSTSSQLGIPGLMLYLTFLLAIIWPLRRLSLRWRSLLPDDRFFLWGQAIFIGLVALLLQALGLSVTVNKYLWLLLGMGAAFLRVSHLHLSLLPAREPHL